MEQALDKLRDKTLNFWCVAVDKKHTFFWWPSPEQMITVSDDPDCYKDDGLYFIHYRWSPTVHFPLSDVLNKDLCEIIWHPLTWWRITSLYWEQVENGAGDAIVDVYIDLGLFFDRRYQLYDKNETQWMKHEKRPELFDLLKEFASLLPECKDD